jgi:hypothetical protein
VGLTAVVGPVVGVVPGTFVGDGAKVTVGLGLTPGTFVGEGEGLIPGAVVGVGDGLAPGHKQSTSLVQAGLRQTPVVVPEAIRQVMPESQSKSSSHHPSQLLLTTSKLAVQTSCGAGVAVGFSAACGMLCGALGVMGTVAT